MYPVCVLYTGALRTIRHTLPYLRQHVLLHTDVHVFACLQNDSGDGNEDVGAWLNAELGPHLKHIEWFDPADPTWRLSAKTRVGAMDLPSEQTRRYLLSSGSMIEYAQLARAYEAMVRKEMSRSRPYMYVIRCRTDTIFAKPIDFHWLSLTPDDLQERIHRITELLKEDERYAARHSLPRKNDILSVLMATLVDKQLITNIPDMYEIVRDDVGARRGLDTHELPSLSDLRALTNYICYGKYILTVRKNLLYIARRRDFWCIPLLGTSYGMFRLPRTWTEEDNYWWNAESQFQAACYLSNLTIYNYDTDFECKSLYKYKKENYFDDAYNLTAPRPMLYCLVRPEEQHKN